jgi:glycosyltransferase involved in cell wall biosynthesis
MNAAAIVCAFNEAERIGDTLCSIGRIPGVTRVIVVDDGSRDGTAGVAEALGASVCRIGRNGGKGNALERGCEFLEDLTGLAGLDAVLLLDADLADSAVEAQALLKVLEDGQADMAIARFSEPGADSAAKRRRGGFGLVLRLARAAIRDLGGFDAKAPLSGQRALTLPCLSAVRPFEGGWGVEVAMSVHALWAGMRLVEKDCRLAHRATGRDISGFLHRGRQYIDVSRTVRRLRRHRADRAETGGAE